MAGQFGQRWRQRRCGWCSRRGNFQPDMHVLPVIETVQPQPADPAAGGKFGRLSANRCQEFLARQADQKTDLRRLAPKVSTPI